MKTYFWLTQDNHVNNIVMIKGIIQQVSLDELRVENLTSIPELTVFPTTVSSKNNVYPDVFSSQIFIVQKENRSML